MRSSPASARSPLRGAAALSLALLFAMPSRAAVTKYKGWDRSPEAYFLTKAERAAWASVDDDEKAEVFVNAYRAARGGGFGAAIKSRIDFADKAFKLGKKKGSETLRGRALIVLGPPTRIESVVTPGAKEKADPLSGEAGNSGPPEGKSSGGVGNVFSNVGGPGPETLRGISATPRTETTRWHYEKSAVPPALAIEELKLEFTVELDGHREEAKDAPRLNRMIDSVIEYWAPKR